MLKLKINFKFTFILGLILLSLSPSSHAKDQTQISLEEKASLANLRNVKNQEVDSYLLDNEIMKDCRKGIKDEDLVQAAVKDKIKECFFNSLNQIDDDEIEKIGTDLNLEGYGVVNDNSAPSIKSYFDSRLSETLYGKKDPYKDGMLKIRDQKFVDQKLFFDLYDNQLSKNTLLKLSEFCLKYEYDTSCKDTAYENCFTAKDKKDLNYDKVKANLSTNKTPQQLKAQWSACAQTIPKLCKRYREKNSSIGNGLTKDTFNAGNDSAIDSTKLPMARLSCVVVDHLKKHRETLVKLNAAKKEIDPLQEGKGFNLGSTFKKTYSGNAKDGKTLDELTTVSSVEVTSQHDYDEDVKLAEKCLAAAPANPNNKDCEMFFKVVEKKDQEKLILDYELKAMVNYKQLDNKIGKMDKQELEEYFRDQGDNTLAEEIKKNTDAEIEIIKDNYRKKFKAEKLAMINELKAKVDSMEVVKNDNATDIKNKVEEIKITQEQKQDNLKGLYHYSNVVTSYLDKDGSTDLNTVGLQAEMRDITDNGADQYFQSLQPNQPGGSSSNTSSTLVDIGLLNDLLREEPKNSGNATN